MLYNVKVVRFRQHAVGRWEGINFGRKLVSILIPNIDKCSWDACFYSLSSKGRRETREIFDDATEIVVEDFRFILNKICVGMDEEEADKDKVEDRETR
ncbi:hypothetical protein Trydic_g3579 [Trypoxylus dichotomus]